MGLHLEKEIMMILLLLLERARACSRIFIICKYNKFNVVDCRKILCGANMKLLLEIEIHCLQVYLKLGHTNFHCFLRSLHCRILDIPITICNNAHSSYIYAEIQNTCVFPYFALLDYVCENKVSIRLFRYLMLLMHLF
jgi:hypothetical protein